MLCHDSAINENMRRVTASFIVMASTDAASTKISVDIINRKNVFLSSDHLKLCGTVEKLSGGSLLDSSIAHWSVSYFNAWWRRIIRFIKKHLSE